MSYLVRSLFMMDARPAREEAQGVSPSSTDRLACESPVLKITTLTQAAARTGILAFAFSGTLKGGMPMPAAPMTGVPEESNRSKSGSWPGLPRSPICPLPSLLPPASNPPKAKANGLPSKVLHCYTLLTQMIFRDQGWGWGCVSLPLPLPQITHLGNYPFPSCKVSLFCQSPRKPAPDTHCLFHPR